ncbi:hypothetical protein LXL04_036458 [Taraxacum kok-saghyz]
MASQPNDTFDDEEYAVKEVETLWKNSCASSKSEVAFFLLDHRRHHSLSSFFCPASSSRYFPQLASVSIPPPYRVVTVKKLLPTRPSPPLLSVASSALVDFSLQILKKQTVFLLQTADVWATSSSAELCRCGFRFLIDIVTHYHHRLQQSPPPPSSSTGNRNAVEDQRQKSTSRRRPAPEIDAGEDQRRTPRVSLTLGKSRNRSGFNGGIIQVSLTPENRGCGDIR